MPKLIALATLSVAAAVGVAGVASASSASGTAWITKQTPSYSSPSEGSAPVHFLDQGAQVDALCFTEGQSLRDRNVWIRIGKDGTNGYVHRDVIGGLPADLRHC